MADDRSIHDKGVIHRDIKPTNLMLTEVDGRNVYKLIDFSISAVERDSREDVSETLQTGTTTLQALAGTPHFMSPEQIREGTAITPQTDLWSLGVVIFQALSGHLPFAPEETDRMKIAYAIVHNNLRSCRMSLKKSVESLTAFRTSQITRCKRTFRSDLTQLKRWRLSCG